MLQNYEVPVHNFTPAFKIENMPKMNLVVLEVFQKLVPVQGVKIFKFANLFINNITKICTFSFN